VSAPRWVWPVPSLGDRHATISDGFGSRRRNPNGSSRPHLGADLMFRRRTRTDLADSYRPHTPNGTPWFFMPDGVPALAAAAGEVRLARRLSTGYSVVIVHEGAWATYCTHMSALTVAGGAHVVAGQVIGTVGADPHDGAHLKHLHFELWRHGKQSGVVDPARYLAAWDRVPLLGWSEPGVRNGGLVYRRVVAPGEPYPAWVRALDGQSGVYVIRERDERGDPVVVYVGESHTDHLLGTLTRHLQSWRRWKNWWAGHYSEGHDPGLTYARDKVEVAVRVLSPNDAVEEEARLIRRLRPRDNLLKQPDLEEAPF
jgi:hypothetical protein